MRWPCSAYQLWGDWPWSWDICNAPYAVGSSLYQALLEDSEFVFVGLLDTRARQLVYVTGIYLASNDARTWSSDIDDAVASLFRHLPIGKSDRR